MPARRAGGRTLFVSGVLALVVLVASCGGGKGSDSGSGGDTSNGSNEACTLQGDFTSDESWTGDAFMEFAGDQQADVSLSFNVYRADAPFVVEFEGDNGESLLVCGGDPFTGSRSTSDTLGLRVDLGDGGVSATSSSGECTVDMISMKLGSVEGDFECEDVSSGDQTFSVVGTFSASSPFGGGDSVVP
jgi:hypothetical protein